MPRLANQGPSIAAESSFYRLLPQAAVAPRAREPPRRWARAPGEAGAGISVGYSVKGRCFSLDRIVEL
jgi:hypothetical protein